MNVLITGGTGYIGSHIAVELTRAGYTPILLDNFSNSDPKIHANLGVLIGPVPLIEADVRSLAELRCVFRDREIDAVVHCAGLKSVDESERNPFVYYDNNVSGSLTLLTAMKEANVHTLIFSSSACVYGQPEVLPVTESSPVSPQSTYGRTKLIIEDVLRDISRADALWRIAILRYFNPAGAHPSGLIGESPTGRLSNLMPKLCRAASEDKMITVFGTDWSTPDGTGIRDYLHVEDLAAGHVSALKYLEKNSVAVTLNLGVGRGYSVREMIAEFERACGKKILQREEGRRSGDTACVYADPSKARELLKWKAVRGLDAICADAWRYYVQEM